MSKVNMSGTRVKGITKCGIKVKGEQVWYVGHRWLNFDSHKFFVFFSERLITFFPLPLHLFYSPPPPFTFRAGETSRPDYLSQWHDMCSLVTGVFTCSFVQWQWCAVWLTLNKNACVNGFRTMPHSSYHFLLHWAELSCVDRGKICLPVCHRYSRRDVFACVS